jgi:hypothetical protein
MVSTLAKAATPKEPGYTPSTPAPCAPLGKGLSAILGVVYTNPLKHLGKHLLSKPTRNHDLIPSSSLLFM